MWPQIMLEKTQNRDFGVQYRTKVVMLDCKSHDLFRIKTQPGSRQRSGELPKCISVEIARKRFEVFLPNYKNDKNKSSKKCTAHHARRKMLNF